MVFGLIGPEEQRALFARLAAYYQKLYPYVSFSQQEKALPPAQLRELYFTYAGEETTATAQEKMQLIENALAQGYATPLIVLQKKKKAILLDGHRRVRVALARDLGWNALLLVPSKDIDFGVEELVQGQAKDLFAVSPPVSRAVPRKKKTAPAKTSKKPAKKPAKKSKPAKKKKTSRKRKR